MAKRVLLLGGTGAMGVYLSPELASQGYSVDITTREERKSSNKNTRYLVGDAQNFKFLSSILTTEHYDVIVDFMVYSTEVFRERYELLLKSCRQYVFLSSYRVFADVDVITENSPRLLDVSLDTEYLKTDDYSLSKARQENLLRSASRKNWTIVRPAITYSKRRFQLGTLEENTIVWRALRNVPIVLPKEMLAKRTTMTWAGDVSRMIVKLISNKEALGQDFNIATAESHTWSEVAGIYRDLLGLKIKTTTVDQYVAVLGGGNVRYQVEYDRMFDRVVDNSKILSVTGMKQSDLLSLREGLEREMTEFITHPEYVHVDYASQGLIDRLTHARSDLGKVTETERHLYFRNRYPRVSMLLEQLRHVKHSTGNWEKIRRLSALRTRMRAIKRQLRVRTRVRSLVSRARDWRTQQKINRADGAILTLNGYYNYGNIVQRFALQEFLRQKGYTFISYALEPLDVSAPEYGRYCYTSRFLHDRILRKAFDPNDDLPVYIVGSDQVWRNWGYANITSELGYFFLDFLGDKNVKRISYAASFGQSNLKDAWIGPEFIKYAARLVKKFDAISVREQSGVEIMMKTWSVKAQQVLDPTMLLTARDYDDLIRRSPHSLSPAKPIFTYVLATTKKKTEIIHKIAHDMGQEVEEFNWEQLDVLPPVEQWLKNFRDADLVITDSFHGTVFSIINNTSFVVIENANGGLERITSLLEQFGIEGRLVTENDKNPLEVSNFLPIDWTEVNRRLVSLRNESSEWLLRALIEESKSHG